MDSNDQMNQEQDYLTENVLDSDQSLPELDEAKSIIPVDSFQVESSKLNFKYAGFWMRFWAYLLDLIVIGSIDRILINPVFRALDWELHAIGIFAPVSIATAVTFYAYFVLMTKFLGQTLGKMAFGLKVVDLKGKKLSWGTILFREWIGRFISTTVWITYIIVAFLPKKQGLHDLFSDTSVVHEK